MRGFVRFRERNDDGAFVVVRDDTGGKGEVENVGEEVGPVVLEVQRAHPIGANCLTGFALTNGFGDGVGEDFQGVSESGEQGQSTCG